MSAEAGDGPASDRVLDGRSAIRDRNRDAVLDAVLDLFSEDNLSPGPEEVAERAGLSVRSVYRYFDDHDALSRAAIERQLERLAPLLLLPAIGEGGLDHRISRFVEARLRLQAAAGPALRATRMRATFDPIVRDQFESDRTSLREQIERQEKLPLHHLIGQRAQKPGHRIGASGRLDRRRVQLDPGAGLDAGQVRGDGGGQHEVAVGQPLHQRRSPQTVGAVVGEVGLAHAEQPGYRGHEGVVHPQAAHGVVAGRVDAHGGLVRILAGDVEGGLVAEIVNAVEAEELAGGLTGLDDSIRHQQNAVAGVQVKPDLRVAHLRQNTQRQTAGQQQDMATSETLKGAEADAIKQQQKASQIMAERLPGLTDPNAPAANPAAPGQTAQPGQTPSAPAEAPVPKLLPARHPDRFTPGATPSTGEETPAPAGLENKPDKPTQHPSGQPGRNPKP